MRHPKRLIAAVAAALAAAGPAHAFYWDGWPGSGVPAPRTIAPTPAANPQFPPPPGADPKFPPRGEPPGPPGGPPDGPTPVPGPENVPEPATGLAVLTGLGILAARRFRR